MSTLEVREVVHIATEAAALIMEYYESGSFDVKLKADSSPVTAADLASHTLITERLRKISAHPVLSEEDPVDYEERRHWSHFWLVDPLDGTKDFIKRTGDFTVNIALIAAGEPVLGVIAIPPQKVVYFAEKGGGAYKRSAEGEVSIRAALGQTTLRCAVSRFHSSQETVQFCERNKITQTRSYGSALKICKVAEGEVDVYPRFAPTMEWDVAAGHCIVNEGGGKIVSAVTFKPLTYNKESLFNDPFIVSRLDLSLK